jgi:CubicO group peptidase (beta-lactamase class C family)
MFDLSVAPDPAELGIDPDKWASLIDRAHREVDAGLVPSCQLAVARHGRVAALHTYGAADDATRYIIFSCTKPLVASAVWLLIAAGDIDPASTVADLIPEFKTNGKDVITIEQVMLHTSGFPYAPMAPALWLDREARLAKFAQWRCSWEPGTAFEYHASSAHWVLAELITRVTGKDHRDFIRSRVTEALGLPGLQLGVPVGGQDDIARLVATGEPATEDEIEAAIGQRVIPVGEVTEQALLGLNDPVQRSAGLPGGGGVSNAGQLALFYQALLHNPGRLWDPALLADVTGHVRNTFPDPMMGVSANRTLGLVLAGDDGQSSRRHNLGKTVSPGTFGHGGAGGQIAWADPETGISFCYLTNGLDAHVLREGRRGVALSSRAATLLAGQIATDP